MDMGITISDATIETFASHRDNIMQIIFRKVCTVPLILVSHVAINPYVYKWVWYDMYNIMRIIIMIQSIAAILEHLV